MGLGLFNQQIKDNLKLEDHLFKVGLSKQNPFLWNAVAGPLGASLVSPKLPKIARNLNARLNDTVLALFVAH